MPNPPAYRENPFAAPAAPAAEPNPVDPAEPVTAALVNEAKVFRVPRPRVIIDGIRTLAEAGFAIEAIPDLLGELADQAIDFDRALNGPLEPLGDLLEEWDGKAVRALAKVFIGFLPRLLRR